MHLAMCRCIPFFRWRLAIQWTAPRVRNRHAKIHNRGEAVVDHCYCIEENRPAPQKAKQGENIDYEIGAVP